MIIGIIQIVIGGIVLAISLFAGPNGAIQQTVKALWALIGVILMCFGILSIYIVRILKYLEQLYKKSDSIDYMLSESDFDTDISAIKNSVNNIEMKISK